MKKLIRILLCAILLIAVGLSIYSCFDYNGYLNKWNQSKYGAYTSELYELEKDGMIHIQRNFLFKNRFGRNAVIVEQRSEGVKVYVAKGTYHPVIRTHLTMTALRKGMTVQEMVAAVGMPDDKSIMGAQELLYKMPDGVWYSVVISGGGSDAKVRRVGISDVNKSYTNEEVVAFQWTVRLIYLGIAAVLSVVLVLLIKIPNNIRKRKGIASAE